MEKYIKKCLDSVVNQTYSNIEIILINDGSTDNSEKIIKSYEKEYNNIKVISQVNSGPAIAKNVGLDNANGEYIMILDADDWIENNFIEKLMLIAEENDSDIVFFDSIKELENGTSKGKIEISKFSNNSNEEILKMHITCKMPAGAHKIIKRETIIKSNARFSNNLIKGEELQFSIQIINVAKKINFSNNIYYHCLQRKNSQSRKKDKYSFENNALELYDTLQRENLFENYENEYYLSVARFFTLEVLESSLDSIGQFMKETKIIKQKYNNRFNFKKIKSYKYLDRRITILYLLIKYKCSLIFYIISSMLYKNKKIIL